MWFFKEKWVAKPSVFISSTYYDLKHIRSSLEQFVVSLGYDPILSEKGNIAYSSLVPLDESCYKQAQGCDIFVVVIGGRYGSEVSETRGQESQQSFFDTYDSVTKREFENAYDGDIPVYVLIEKSVFSEYETFKRNIGNESVKYAHVDSINIFKFINLVLTKNRNNPVFQFEKESEIESWLKEQWAGLFKDMLTDRGDLKRHSALSEKVTELGNINTTLKHYLEALIDNSSGENAKDIIVNEEKRLEEQRINDKLEGVSIFSGLLSYSVSVEDAKDVFSKAESIEDLLDKIEVLTESNLSAISVLEHWKRSPEIITDVTQVRSILGFEPLDFVEQLPD